MILSNTCKYGLRAVIYLAINAKNGEKIGIKKISADLDIPSPFLGKILQTLAKKKILNSTKGPHGGFGLAKSSEDITMLDVVQIIDGDEIFDICVLSLKSCKSTEHNNAPCPLHKKFHPIRKQITDLFENETIADLAKDIKTNNKIQI